MTAARTLAAIDHAVGAHDELMRAIAQARPGMCVYPEQARAALHAGNTPPADAPLHTDAEAATLDGLLDAARRSLAEFGDMLPLPDHVKARQQAELLAAVTEAHVHVASFRAPWRPAWEPGWQWTVNIPGRPIVRRWAWTRAGAHHAANRRARHEQRAARRTARAMAAAGVR